MKNIIPTLIVAIFVLATVPAVAEIYKYIDADGQKRWTDDLSQVPKEQRPTAQRIESQEDVATPAVEPADQGNANGSQPPSENDGTISDQSTAEPINRDALEKEKADLDEQYSQLMEERKKLEELRAGDLDAKAREELNQRVLAYNKKAESYEKRLSHFNDNVDRFNRKNSAATKAKADQ